MKEKIENAVKGIQMEKDREREPHYRFLLSVAQNNPELLMEYWDVFARMLKKPDVSNPYCAIHLIAELVRADDRDRFCEIFDDFYALLNHESPVVSPHVAAKSGKILRAKPQLEDRIVPLLLAVDKTSRCRHLELQKAYVIEAFSEAFEVLRQKDRIIGFVRDQLGSESQKTRKAARAFLKDKGL